MKLILPTGDQGGGKERTAFGSFWIEELPPHGPRPSRVARDADELLGPRVVEENLCVGFPAVLIRVVIAGQRRSRLENQIPAVRGDSSGAVGGTMCDWRWLPGGTRAVIQGRERRDECETAVFRVVEIDVGFSSLRRCALAVGPRAEHVLGGEVDRFQRLTRPQNASGPLGNLSRRFDIFVIDCDGEKVFASIHSWGRSPEQGCRAIGRGAPKERQIL